MIRIENLSFGYGQKSLLIKQLRLSLSPGNIYGLLGKNGAGKSTLLKMLAGLLFPDEGKIEVLGFQPKDRHPDFLKEVYLITEEFSLPDWPMERFVRFYSPFYPRFDHGLFTAYTEEFQLPEDQKLTTFSYGQKKKFLLSFGLATDCRLLILDEPTNGLDILSKSQFRKVVASAIHEERSFIISTHQVRDMESLIDPIIMLDEGEVVFFADYEQISRKLSFSKKSELPDSSRLVYSESSFSGYTVVEENRGIEETNLNLETLFKAVLSNKEKIREIFKSE